jgi:flagellar basal-body rod modification protein FlgD
MPITPTTNTPATTAAAGSAAQPTRGFMGKDDFMKLLVAQLKHQDPTAPQDMNQMTAQMTQFGMLEQMQNLAATGEATRVSLARTEAMALIGKTVTYADADGNPQTGVVANVDVSANKPKLTVGTTTNIDPESLVSVR